MEKCLTPLSTYTGLEKQLLSIYGVDVGNHDTKYRHGAYTSGIKKSSVVNKLAVQEKGYIKMLMPGRTDEGAYYTLADSPANFADKVKTEEMFIITLFAIAKEAIKRGLSLNGEEICLSIGVPPGMFTEAVVKSYADYYKSRGDVHFYYEEIEFKFTINKVIVSAQCWGAAVQYRFLHKGLPDVYIVDIGGGTIDVIRMKDGAIDGEPLSYNDGVNKMSAAIANTVGAEYGLKFDSDAVKKVLINKSDIPDLYKKRIKELAHEWTRNVFTRMMTEGAEFRLSKVITSGGGSLLMNEDINSIAAELEFLERLAISDNKANATGYEIIAASIIYGSKHKTITDFWVKFDLEHKLLPDNEGVNDNFDNT